MKKTLAIIFIIFICIIIILYIALKNVEAIQRNNNNFNLEYERYLNKEIYGTDLATIINKAVNNNEKYEITKDENEFYIPDENYSINIDIYIAINDTTYKMETIYKHGTSSFVQNFNSILFKLDKIDYHKNTRKSFKTIF